MVVDYAPVGWRDWGGGCEGGELDGNDPLAHDTAVLCAHGEFLADIAALVEVEPVRRGVQVEILFVWEGAAGGKELAGGFGDAVQEPPEIVVAQSSRSRSLPRVPRDEEAREETRCTIIVRGD